MYVILCIQHTIYNIDYHNQNHILEYWSSYVKPTPCPTCPMWLPREEPSWRGLLGGCSPNKALLGERAWGCCWRTGGWPGWELRQRWLRWSLQTIVTVVSLHSFGRTIFGVIMALGVWKEGEALCCDHLFEVAAIIFKYPGHWLHCTIELRMQFMTRPASVILF